VGAVPALEGAKIAQRIDRVNVSTVLILDCGEHRTAAVRVADAAAVVRWPPAVLSRAGFPPTADGLTAAQYGGDRG
jgi:hypothetical protein